MEDFIKNVQKYPCLWKIDAAEYKIKAFKDQAWDDLAKESGLPDAHKARVLWKNLRDGHRQALKNRKQGTWRYDPHMAFLLPYYKGTRRRSETQSFSSDEESYILVKSNDDDSVNTNENKRKFHTSIAEDQETPRKHVTLSASSSSEDRGCHENFIENVEKFPCVWNINVPEYKNKALRERAWIKIAKISGLTNAHEARVVWKKLRDGHRQALRNKTNDAWKYGKLMEFLIPHMGNRYRPSHSISTDEDTGLDYQSEESDIKEAGSSSKRIKNKYNDDSSNTTLNSNKNEQVEFSTCTFSENSALEKFFSSMYETTCSLTDKLQLRVQREIFNLVMAAKEEQLNIENPL